MTFFNIFIRCTWSSISRDFILHFDNIKFAKIMKIIIFDSWKLVVYKAHRCLNINKVYKTHYFKHWIILNAILKSLFFHSIENVSKITVWNSNHVNLVNDNAIEMNFNDFLLEVLHLFLVREFNFINISSVNFRTYSRCIKVINVYDLNRKTRFRKWINLRCVFN